MSRNFKKKLSFQRNIRLWREIKMDDENKSFEEMIPRKTYSPLHYKVLEADAWAHDVGLKRIATDRALDMQSELKVESLMDACFDEFERYTREERKHDVTLHGDLAYALRIMAKIAGPKENVITVKVGDEPEQRHVERFGFDLLKQIARIYNNVVGKGERLQRVQLEYYKGDEEQGEIRRAYVALNKDELILEEVA